jgi:hypothetical protein
LRLGGPIDRSPAAAARLGPAADLVNVARGVTRSDVALLVGEAE